MSSDELEALATRFEAMRSVHKERIEGLEDQIKELSDDARADRAELRATVEGLEDEVAKLRFELEQLRGLGATETSTPAARVRDLRSAMIQRARSLDSRSGIKLWWREVQNLLADNNHGEVSKPDCYKAMEEAAGADGFELSTKKNANGNQVKAIRLKTDALPAAVPSSDPTTAEGVHPGENGGEIVPEDN